MIKISRSRIRPLEHGAAVSASTRLSLCSSFLIVQLLKIFLKENQNDVRPSNLQGRIAVTAEPTTRMQDFVVLINSPEFWWLKCYPVGGWLGLVGTWAWPRHQCGIECNITSRNCVTNVTNLILTFLNRPEPLTWALLHTCFISWLSQIGKLYISHNLGKMTISVLRTFRQTS